MSDTRLTSNVLERIQKLLTLAADGSGATEAEAALAASHVQRLLTEYNLTLAEIGATRTQDTDKRGKTTHDKAAMYSYQQNLMGALARNNFCHHWIKTEMAFSNGRTRKVKRHVVLGREVNSITTRMTYDYLVITMDRLLPYQGMAKRGREALLWLAGCTERLTARINEQRIEAEDESRRRADEAAARAKRSGDTPGNALVLVDVYANEDELNQDVHYGRPLGTTTTRRLEAEAREAAADARQAELVANGTPMEDAYYIARHGKVPQWVLDSRAMTASPKPDTETDAQRKAREAKEERQRQRWDEQSRRRQRKEDERRYDPAFRAGAEAGDQIRLNRQIDRARRERIGG